MCLQVQAAFNHGTVSKARLCLVCSGEGSACLLALLASSEGEMREAAAAYTAQQAGLAELHAAVASTAALVKRWAGLAWGFTTFVCICTVSHNGFSEICTLTVFSPAVHVRVLMPSGQTITFMFHVIAAKVNSILPSKIYSSFECVLAARLALYKCHFL